MTNQSRHGAPLEEESGDPWGCNERSCIRFFQEPPVCSHGIYGGQDVYEDVLPDQPQDHGRGAFVRTGSVARPCE